MSEVGAITAAGCVLAASCVVASVSPVAEAWLDHWVGGGVLTLGGGALLWLLGREIVGSLTLSWECRRSIRHQAGREESAPVPHVAERGPW